MNVLVAYMEKSCQFFGLFFLGGGGIIEKSSHIYFTMC